MIFSELCSAYYNAVARILAEAVSHPVDRKGIRKIIEKNAFGESALTIESAIAEERWQLIKSDGSTNIKHAPTMPLTLDQKRWIKAVSLDPRIRLFTEDIPDYPDVEPLFTQEDICFFDRYLDGDHYEDEGYIRRFRTILKAIKEQTLLEFSVLNRYGNERHTVMLPDHLEYSEKDDKFRLYCSGNRRGAVINLARIESCKPTERYPDSRFGKDVQVNTRMLELEIKDERNALERVLLHFAHFEKQVEKLDDGRYRMILNYDQSDETEMVIRVLSFGPMVKVREPLHFVDLIKERLIKQMSCGH